MKTAKPFETPTIVSAFENEAKDLVASGQEKLDQDWSNKEVKVCKNCRGYKFDPEDMSVCIACDGTGVDMMVEYGVENGKFFSRLTQNGVEAIKTVCAERREIEMRKGMMKRAAASMTHAYYLPESARLELQFKYPDWEHMEQQDIRKCANIVRRHYPEFMTTNYIF